MKHTTNNEFAIISDLKQESKQIDATTQVWNSHYQTDKSKQLYPDENLVRLLSRYKQNPLIQNKKLTALDYGFGSGRHLSLLDDFGFDFIAGYDISEIAVDLAQKRFNREEFTTKEFNREESNKKELGKKEPGRKEFNNNKFDLQLLKPNTSLHYPDSSFDIIVVWGVFHYIPNMERTRLLHDLKRLLRNNGQLFGTLRSTKDTQYTVSEVSKAQIQFFTEAEATSLLKPFFNKLELGFMERSPIGQLESRVSHWFFSASNQE